jgi:hypothetical protein
METITVKKPSVPVMRKLHKGQPATLTKGDDYEVVVSAEMAKKIKKAHDKGKGIRVKLEADAITEMEGKGAWDWVKKTVSKGVSGVEKAADTVSTAVIGKSATKAIEKTGKIALNTAGKAAKTVGLATAKSLPTILKTGGAIAGGVAGSALAVEMGQPELAPIGGFIGSQIGSQIFKDIGEEGKKIAVPVIRGKKKTTTKKPALPDRIPTPKKPKLPSPADPKKPAVPDAYLGRDTSGRLKTFSTLTGATADAVPVETQFQGTGKAKKPPKEKKPSKKGSQEMKDKMAKLRALRKKKMSGEGLVAEGSGEGLVAEGSGEGITMEIKDKDKMTKLPIEIKPKKEKKMTGKGSVEMKEKMAKIREMKGKGKQTGKDKEDEKLAMKVRDIVKKVAVIEKEHDEMTGDGLKLGEDPSTYTPTPAPTPPTPPTLSQSAQRPDHERGHHIQFRPSRFDGISGSKLIGRRHQAFHSQAHATHHMWKTTLGMPR